MEHVKYIRFNKTEIKIESTMKRNGYLRGDDVPPFLAELKSAEIKLKMFA